MERGTVWGSGKFMFRCNLCEKSKNTCDCDRASGSSYETGSSPEILYDLIDNTITSYNNKSPYVQALQ